MLVCAKMEANEAVLLKGMFRYSNYSGYGGSLRFASAVKHSTVSKPPPDILAIDSVIAFRLPSTEDQFSKVCFFRDLNKVYCGLLNEHSPPELVEDRLASFASGNWGCGAFGGDRQLKALQQLLAAIQCEIPLVYFTFGDVKLVKDCSAFIEHLEQRKATVGDVIQAYLCFLKNRYEQAFPTNSSLFTILLGLLNQCD